MQRVRIEHEGAPAWGRLRDGAVVLDSGTELDPGNVGWLAPVEPSKILAVHLTYRSRLVDYDARQPPEPSYFMKPPSSLNGHLGVIRRPRGARYLNYEGELAVVVGRRMHGVLERDVLDHVYGFAPANDVGLHDFRHADRGSMLRVKGQDGFLPIGPALVTKDEWTPDEGYTLTTLLNGEVVQRGDQDDIIWDYRYQLADLSRLITLEPGDVVLTGTPANSRPMQPGDTVEVEIGGTAAPDQHRRRLGRRPERAGRSDPGLRQHAARRARDPGGRGRRARARGKARAMIALRRIHHVCLRVADLDEAVRRWSIQFGFSERARAAHAQSARTWPAATSRSRSSCGPRAASPGTTTPASSCARVARPDDAAAHLDGLGIAYRRDEHDHLFLSDPEGYGVEIVPSAPRDPYPDVGRSTTTLPGFRARKLGHVNVLTGKLEQMRDFYRDALGMRITDYLGGEGIWFHVNADHHVMALVGKTPAHFHHFALDLVDWGTLRVAFDHLGQHGRWLGWGPVRHALGQNLCGYVRIPQEQLFVELYCDMEVLDLPHTAREWRDDPRGSNLWGILPPRSYFRFDEAAVESERLQLEALGTPLPPL